MKKRAIAMLLAGALCASIAGCSNQSTDADAENASTASGSSGEPQYHVSVILKTLAAEYWQYVKAGAEAYGEEHPDVVSVDVKGPSSETAFDEMQNMIETDLNSSYDGIIISPLQSDTAAQLVSGVFLADEVQYANATADNAVTCMEAIMQTHPEGIAIICANNDDMAMAAARAAAGNEAYANTIFLGFNGDRAACDAIISGQLTMSVVQMAYEMGYKAVETMVQALNGEEVEPFVDSGSEVITIDNAQTRLETLDKQLSN